MASHEHKPNLLVHWVHATWFIDGQASYNFTFMPPVENAPVPGYSKDAKDMVRGKDSKVAETAPSADRELRFADVETYSQRHHDHGRLQ